MYQIRGLDSEHEDATLLWNTGMYIGRQIMANKLYVAIEIKSWKIWVLIDVTILEEKKGKQNQEDEKLNTAVGVQW